ncbi:hypothetical protein [Streptomyces sp. NPDC020141]|uniref:hypothetical protein n=1 Tax=Streptomyces sp. NPDC020141 TaxID=3365065 RepID=UPI00378CB54B
MDPDPVPAAPPHPLPGPHPAVGPEAQAEAEGADDGTHYPYRVAGGGAELTLLWWRGDGDRTESFAVDGAGRLLAFRDRAALREHCGRAGLSLVDEEDSVLDLRPVGRWVRRGGTPPDQSLLEAWNAFEDLARSLPDGPPLPAQGPLHDSAYVKLFGGSALEPDAGDESWTPEETAAARGFLAAGLRLWEAGAREAVLR